MLDEKARYVFVHRLVLHPKPIDGPPVDLRDLVSFLKARFDTKASHKLIENETQAVRILDFKYRSSVPALVLLVQLADRNVADPSFADLDTGETRTVHKKPNEGGAVTAHVVIGLDSEINADAAGSPRAYPMLLEEVPRLTRSIVASLLKQEIRKASKDAGLSFEVSPKKSKSLRANTNVEGVPANLFDDELDGAAIRGVELVAYEQGGDGYESEIEIKERRRILLIKPTEPATGSKIQAFIAFARKLAVNQKYDMVRLRYERDDGRERTAAVGIEAQDGMERMAQALTRCEYLQGFTKPLPQSAEAIREDLVGKMIALLKP